MRDAPTLSAVGGSSRLAARRRAWPWAVGSLLAVALVLGATVLARHEVVAHTPPTAFAPPALPPLDAIAVARPEAGASLVALDSSDGHLVALAVPSERFCPPVGACSAPPAPDAFVVLDGRSGQTLASTLLAGDPATAARVLLADVATHRAYAIGPQAVTIFSTDSGARVGGFALPSGFAPDATSGSSLGATLDPARGALTVVMGESALQVRADTGQTLAQAALPGGHASVLLDGPVVDPLRSRLYLLLGAADGSGQPQLVALDARTLRPLQQRALPAGARLGPMDAPGVNLAVFGADGTTWHVPLDALAADQLALTPVPALRDALALGENAPLGHQYVADAGATRALSESGPVAALPLPARWPPSVPLLVDAARGLVYLPAAHGALVIVQDTASAPASRALSPTAAVLLAQSALFASASDSQDPPFFTPDMFPLQVGRRAQEFWTYSAAHGFQGPDAGQTGTQVSPTPGGGYQVTFTLAWQQLFAHQHVWVWSVAPDGGTLLTTDSGDGVP